MWKIEPKERLETAGGRLEDSSGMDNEEIGCGMWTGFIWLKTGSNGRLL
jgi:hypothetical protein